MIISYALVQLFSLYISKKETLFMTSSQGIVLKFYWKYVVLMVQEEGLCIVAVYKYILHYEC